MKIVIGAVYRHKKRGAYYEVLGRAKMQIDSEHLVRRLGRPNSVTAVNALESLTFVVYRALEDDTIWVRPETEFCDGRFEREI